MPLPHVVVPASIRALPVVSLMVLILPCARNPSIVKPPVPPMLRTEPLQAPEKLLLVKLTYWVVGPKMFNGVESDPFVLSVGPTYVNPSILKLYALKKNTPSRHVGY